MHKNKRGFTIVELLIVIVVIAILAAISIVAYNGIQQRGRMATRASDVSSIQKALEIYRADNGVYPAALATTAANLPTGFAGSYGCVTCYAYSVSTNSSWLKTMLDANTISQAIKDPINNNSNFYTYWTSDTGWPANGCTGPFYILVVESPGAGTLKGSRAVNCNGAANFTTSADRAVYSNIITP